MKRYSRLTALILAFSLVITGMPLNIDKVKAQDEEEIEVKDRIEVNEGMYMSVEEDEEKEEHEKEMPDNVNHDEPLGESEKLLDYEAINGDKEEKTSQELIPDEDYISPAVVKSVTFEDLNKVYRVGDSLSITVELEEKSTMDRLYFVYKKPKSEKVELIYFDKIDGSNKYNHHSVISDDMEDGLYELSEYSKVYGSNKYDNKVILSMNLNVADFSFRVEDTSFNVNQQETQVIEIEKIKFNKDSYYEGEQLILESDASNSSDIGYLKVLFFKKDGPEKIEITMEKTGDKLVGKSEENIKSGEYYIASIKKFTLEGILLEEVDPDGLIDTAIKVYKKDSPKLIDVKFNHKDRKYKPGDRIEIEYIFDKEIYDKGIYCEINGPTEDSVYFRKTSSTSLTGYIYVRESDLEGEYQLNIFNLYSFDRDPLPFEEGLVTNYFIEDTTIIEDIVFDKEIYRPGEIGKVILKTNRYKYDRISLGFKNINNQYTKIDLKHVGNNLYEGKFVVGSNLSYGKNLLTYNEAQDEYTLKYRNQNKEYFYMVEGGENAIPSSVTIEYVELNKDSYGLGDQLELTIKTKEDLENSYIYLDISDDFIFDGSRPVAEKIGVGTYKYVTDITSNFKNGEHDIELEFKQMGNSLYISYKEEIERPQVKTKDEDLLPSIGAKVKSFNINKERFNSGDQLIIKLELDKHINKDTFSSKLSFDPGEYDGDIIFKRIDDKNYEGKLIINDNIPSGSHTVDLRSYSPLTSYYLIDNYSLEIGDTDYKEYYDKDVEEDKKRKISDIILDKTSYKYTDEIEATVSLDGPSTYNYIKLIFKKENSEEYINVLTTRVGDKTYRGIKLLDEFDVDGNYYLTSVAGSYNLMDSSVKIESNKFKDVKFNLSGNNINDGKAIKVKSVKTNKNFYNLGDILSLDVEVDYEFPPIDEIVLEYVNTKTNKSMYVVAGKIGPKLYRYSQVISKDLISGIYSLSTNYIRGNSKYNNEIVFSDNLISNNFTIKSRELSYVEKIDIRKDYEAGYLEYEVVLDKPSGDNELHITYGSNNTSLEIELVKIDDLTYRGIYKLDNSMLEKTYYYNDISSYTNAVILDESYFSEEDLKISLSKKDEDKPPVVYPPTEDKDEPAKEYITYEKEYGSKIEIPYESKIIYNPDMVKGESKKTPGKKGYEIEIWEVTYKKGKEIYRKLMGSELLVSPVDEIIEIGSKEDLNPEGEQNKYYKSRGVNVRNLDGKIIGYISPENIVKGKDLGDKVEINYKGQVGYIHKKFIKEKDEVLSDSYLSRGAVIRNDKGEKLGYLKAGEEIKGIKVLDRIEFEYKGQIVSVHQNFIINQSKKAYTSSGVRVRSKEGVLLGYLPFGSVIEGKDLGNRLEIDYLGKKAYVHKNYLEEGIWTSYKSKGVNIRDLEGKLIGYLPSGRLIRGIDLGNKIEIYYEDKKAVVYKRFLEKDYGKTYTSKGVNVRDKEGNIIGKIKAGSKIRGRLINNLIEIDYEGRKATVHSKFVD